MFGGKTMKNLKVKVMMICVLGLIGNSWAGNEIVTTYYGSPKGDYLSMKAKILQLSLTDNENYHVDDQQAVCGNLGEGALYVNSNNEIKICPRVGEYRNSSLSWKFLESPYRTYINPLTTKVGIGTSDPQYQLDLGASDGKKLAIQSGANSFIGLGINNPDKLSFFNGASNVTTPPAELSSNGDFYVLGNMTASDFTMSKGGRTFKFDATAASGTDTYIRFKNTTNPSAVTLGDMAVGQFWQDGNSIIVPTKGIMTIGKTATVSPVPSQPANLKLDVAGGVNIAGDQRVTTTTVTSTLSVMDKVDVGSNNGSKQDNQGQFILPVYINGKKPACENTVGCMWIQKS